MSESVTITTSSLAQALGAVTPFASRDITLPALCSVQLRATGGILTATATDRYAIGHARQAADGQLTGPRYLHRRDVKNLRKELTRHVEARKSGADLATITESTATITVAFGATTMTFVEPATSTHAPDLGEILSSLPTRDASGLNTPLGLSRRTLRPLLKAAAWDTGSPPRWTFDGPRKPVRVEIGDWFIAALMPVSLRGDEKPVPVEMPAPAQAASK